MQNKLNDDPYLLGTTPIILRLSELNALVELAKFEQKFDDGSFYSPETMVRKQQPVIRLYDGLVEKGLAEAQAIDLREMARHGSLLDRLMAFLFIRLVYRDGIQHGYRLTAFGRDTLSNFR